MVLAEFTVIAGVGDAKKAARNIDAWLRIMVYEQAEKMQVLHLMI